MKILHLCNKVPFPGRDGSSLAMEALIRLEVKAGHSVHVLALNTDKHYVHHPQAHFGSTLECVKVRISPSLLGFMRQVSHPASYFASRFDHASVRNRIQVLAPEVDLVVVDSLFMALYLECLGGTPWVLRAHNVEHQIWQRALSQIPFGLKKIFTAWQTMRLKRWELAIIKSARIWAISFEDSSLLLQLGAAESQTIPCTFDAFGPWSDSGAKGSGIYHLGALDWLPNVQGLQWYVEEVHPISAQEIIVISKKWPSQLVRPEKINHLARLEDGFDFESHGIFIAPILSGSGMRVKLLEAMVRGKAIVTTSIGAAGLKDAPGVLIADRPEEFAEAIRRLVDNTEFRQSQGRAARAHALATFADEVFVNDMRSLAPKRT
ncbi:MAG: glycosyltransferase [Schleiferiaceae bacterium]|nr:glycosyltransferase [Schleiferiaceae bacterium]